MSFVAYKRILQETESPRQIERRILARLTGQLEQHQIYFDNLEPADRLPLLAGELNAALWENQQFWQALMVDLAEPDNGLPPDLRAGLLSIGGWVEHHTNAILDGTADLAPLVEVNRNIERGLAGEVLPATAMPAAAQPGAPGG
jgi:flagellar biosynthesis activator protein FlaF